MGCDIHSFAEVWKNGVWVKVGDVFPLDNWEKGFYKKDFNDEPIIDRHYGLFGWLADVRNYSRLPPISQPRGLPTNLSLAVLHESATWGLDGHSYSWLSLAELLEADYEQIVWDRRVMRQESSGVWNGAALANEGEGKHLSLRECLPDSYFKMLEVLKTLGEPENVRIVFWFDN